jgi:hypothetical protein
MENSSIVQSDADPKSIGVWFDDDIVEDMWSFLGWCDNVKHDCVDSDPVKSNMASRMFVKAAKYAGICAVFNSQNEAEVKICVEEWNWAKDMVVYELDNVNSTLGNLNGGGEMSDAIRDVCIKITQLLTGQLKNKNAKLTKPEIDRKVIVLYQLDKVCQSCKNVKKLGDGNVGYKYKSALGKVLDYMADERVITMLDVNPITKREQRVIKVNESFNEFCKQFIE